MNKRVLMLTAATAALLAGQASAQQDFITEQTNPQNTAADGNIIIDTNGEIVIVTNPPTGPAVTINGPLGATAGGSSTTPATVTNTTNITYQSLNGTVGVLLEEAAPPTTPTGVGAAEYWTGEYISGPNSTNATTGVIDLTGTGAVKTGILIAGGAYNGNGASTNAGIGAYASTSSSGNLGVFTGVAPSAGADPVAINLEKGSTLEVQGVNSYGINLIGPSYSSNVPSGGATLIGDIDIAGAVETIPVEDGSLTTGQQNVAINIAGWEQPTPSAANPALAGTAYAGDAYAMVGNLNIQPGGVVSSYGEDAQGIDVLGALDGSIVNYGTIQSYGTTNPPTSAYNVDDPEGGSALAIGNNVTGGIYNAGTIGMLGTSSTIDISPSVNTSALTAIGTTTGDEVPVTIGAYAGGAYTNQFSLYSTGSVSAETQDADLSTTAISIAGANSTDTVTLTGGIFNSGSIAAAAGTNVNGVTVNATAISIGQYVAIGTGSGITGGNYSLINSNEAGSGLITANVSGTQTGTATAILITGSQNPGGGLQSIFNSGTISASATTTNPNNTTLLAAYAIQDQSGTLTSIVNEGTISATVSPLYIDTLIPDGVAIDVSSNSTAPVTIADGVTTGYPTLTAPATITGDIKFGKMPGTLTVAGTNATDDATVTGNISFDNTTATNDTLTVGPYGTVTGEVKENSTGAANITIDSTGTLNLLSTLPTYLYSRVVAAPVSADTPLNVGTLTVNTGGLLNISLSQGNNVNAFPSNNVTVINAANANIGGDGITPTLKISFDSFVAAPSAPNGSSQFVLISTPSTGTFTITAPEMSLLTANYTGASSTTNGIPFLFSSSICTYGGVTNGTPCSGTTGPYTAGNKELVLTLTPKTAAQLGLTGYASQMFKYVNEALVNDDTLGAAMINNITNTQTAQAAYAQFVPDVTGASRATAISLTDSATNVVAARQRELRMYAGQDGDTTLWGQQFAQRLSQDNSRGLTGWDDSGFGFVLGVDSGDPVDGRYGGALTFYGGGMSEKGPTMAKTEEEFYLLTGYTDWRGKGLFLDTQGTIGYGNLKGDRYLVVGDVSRDAQSQRPTELLSGSAATGAIFTAGGTVFTPQFDLDGLTMREEGYTEANGGEGFDLHVASSYSDSLRAFLGADVREDVNFGDFFFQPELRMGYRYDFIDGAVKLKVNFASVDSANNQSEDLFSVTGPDPGHGNLVLGGGFATTTGAWSIGLNYDYVRSGNGPTEQTGIVTLVGRI